MGPLLGIGDLVGVQVRVVEDHPPSIADAPQRVAGGVRPDLIAADGPQLLQGARHGRAFFARVAADGDQVGEKLLLLRRQFGGFVGDR